MDFETLNQLFFASMETYRRSDALTYKTAGGWCDLGWDELLRRVRDLTLGLHEVGIRHGDRVVLLSENRLEWFLIDKALLGLGAASVPIYPTLSSKQAAFIIGNSEAKMAIASSASQQTKLQEIRNELPGVEHWVRIDPAAETGFEALALEDLAARGARRAEREPGLDRRLAGEVHPGDLATIIYTSGTTGDPKGVMLTHSNLVSNVKGSQQVLPLGPADVALSVLPWCHVFERMVAHYLYLAAGARLVIAESLDALAQNLLEIRPTVMCCVPRFYEKLYGRVMESVSAGSPLRQRIFWWAVGVGKRASRYLMTGRPLPPLLELSHRLASALVFKKLQGRIGGRLRFFVSGGAPLPPAIGEFFWAAGIPILEGYGLTETSPVLSVNQPRRVKLGTVGPAIPRVELRIAEDGEILARGPNIMKGYYRNQTATSEAVDRDGWFHTGDVGALDEDGFLSITDRKKDLIVTSGGKNIAPQAIENRLKTNPYITEIVMVGNRRSYPSALVAPDFAKLTAWAHSQGILADSRTELARHPRVRDFVQQQIDGMSADLATFERIKRITLIDKEFTLAGGELTPTLKVRRNVIEERYRELIDHMYSEA
jgi:long-chain acyl-CoA synthetase